jgi:hypothetical protein
LLARMDIRGGLQHFCQSWKQWFDWAINNLPFEHD